MQRALGQKALGIHYGVIGIFDAFLELSGVHKIHGNKLVLQHFLAVAYIFDAHYLFNSILSNPITLRDIHVYDWHSILVSNNLYYAKQLTPVLLRNEIRNNFHLNHPIDYSLVTPHLIKQSRTLFGGNTADYLLRKLSA
jgi:hypothetical protein